MKKLITGIISIASACAIIGSPVTVIPQQPIASADSGTILLVEGQEIGNWVTDRLEEREYDVRKIENEALDSINGDIRQLNICSTLQYCGISADCIHREEYVDSVKYTIDINSEWNLQWDLAREFGNSANTGASYVLNHFNDGNLRNGWIHISTGKDIIFETCERSMAYKFDHAPFQTNDLPKVVVAEGDWSANSYEFAMALLLCEAVQPAGSSIEPATSEPATSAPSSAESRDILTMYDETFAKLDLAACSNVVESMLDNGADIRYITAGDAIAPATPGRGVNVTQSGNTVNFAIRDGLRNVDVTWQDVDIYERKLPSLTLHDRFKGCTYTADIETFMDITDKKIRVTIHCDGDTVKEYFIPEYDCNNYFLTAPNGELISAETLSIISTLLKME